MPRGSASHRLRLLASVVVALGLAGVAAREGRTQSRAAYLPIALQRTALDGERCAVAAACPGAEGWRLHCGGIGRIRDMLAVPVLGDGGAGLIAIGDGAAAFDVATATWRVQVGPDLSGLAGLYVPDRGSGWAVGERARIARYEIASGCWHVDGREAHLNGRVSIDAVMTSDEATEGWAVGRKGPEGQLLWMRQAAGRPGWHDVSRWIPDLSPLTDVHLLGRQPDGSHRAWLVSPPEGRVLVTRLGGPDTVALEHVVPVVDPQGAALPREVAMRAGPPEEGWLVGSSSGNAEPAVAGWRYASDGSWRAGLQVPARMLVDLYFDGADGAGRWWLGLSPTPRRSPLLRTTDRADGQGSWSTVDARAPDLDPAAAGGNRAVASLPSGQVLYAWGDEVWQFERSTEAWQRVLRRHPVVSIVPTGPTGAWLLTRREAPDGASSRLLELHSGSIRAVVTADGRLELPPLAALSENWAVGDDGVALRLGRGGWQSVSAAEPGLMLLDVAVVRDRYGETAWAVGHDAGGDGVVVVRDATARRWRRLATIPGRTVHAVAAQGDSAWAVGDGVACDCETAGCRCLVPLPFASAADATGGDLALRDVAVWPSPSAPIVWAAGGYYVVRRHPEGWAATTRAHRLAGLPEGAAIRRLASGGPNDLWTLATCEPYPEGGRGVSIVHRLDGALEGLGEVVPTAEVLALGVPLADLRVTGAAGRRAAWLAGDWSTVLSRPYAAGSAPPADPPGGPDLRCVASERPAAP